MTACSILQPAGTVSDLASLQNQRTISAEASLSKLQEIDTLIKLDNRHLSSQIKAQLISQTASSERFQFRRLKLSFNRQTIALEGALDFVDDDGNVISASVNGEILLNFNDSRLEWLPRFDQLQIKSNNFTFNGSDYLEPVPELTQPLLQGLKSEVAAIITDQRQNSIAVNAVPLGEIQVGASMPGFASTPARHTQALRGVFIVAGSSILIESSVTSIALDLAFIPDLSTCPADVTVSRAEFVSGINSREPVGIVNNMNRKKDFRHFYSEIEGAKRPLTIIHYWFADGRPVAVIELPVGPSERWRTWSDKNPQQADVSNWEVLVVEKESGCILHSRSIRTHEPGPAITRVGPFQARKAFATLQDEFKNRSLGFSISGQQPKLALIEIKRPFLVDVLQASLSDLNVAAVFDSASFSPMDFSARLDPFDTSDITCQQRNCAAAPVCSANLAQCKRIRDTRDCSSCLFRNPLNNRCVSEAIDPLCEAARKRQNNKYDAERNACIRNAEAGKRECDQLNAQAVRSCEIEAGFEGSICESVKHGIQNTKAGAPLAHVSAQTRTSGTLRANFSNFLIDGDLQGLKLSMVLESDLQLQGELNFSPATTARPLANCITAWSGPFRSRFSAKPAVSKLLTRFRHSSSVLTADWSGFGISAETRPSPLESVLVGNPQLLANCGVGLTVNKVEQAFSQQDANFFRGLIELEIQPLPTRIHLAPATITLGEDVFSAEATLGPQTLLYTIEK